MEINDSKTKEFFKLSWPKMAVINQWHEFFHSLLFLSLSVWGKEKRIMKGGTGKKGKRNTTR